MSDITEEMVELAAKAIERLKCLTEQEFEESLCRPAIMDIRRKEARAALEAVVPMVVKAERARCAMIAENCEDKFFDIGDKRAALDKPAYWHAAKVVAANAIAAAIRSDNGGET